MKKQYLIIAASLVVTAAGAALLAQAPTIDPLCNCDPPPQGGKLVSSSCGPNPYGGTLTTCTYSCPIQT